MLRGGHLQIVKTLVKGGADVLAKDEGNRQTPCYLSTELNSIKCQRGTPH